MTAATIAATLAIAARPAGAGEELLRNGDFEADWRPNTSNWDSHCVGILTPRRHPGSTRTDWLDIPLNLIRGPFCKLSSLSWATNLERV